MWRKSSNSALNFATLLLTGTNSQIFQIAITLSALVQQSANINPWRFTPVVLLCIRVIPFCQCLLSIILLGVRNDHNLSIRNCIVALVASLKSRGVFLAILFSLLLSKTHKLLSFPDLWICNACGAIKGLWLQAKDFAYRDGDEDGSTVSWCFSERRWVLHFRKMF